jgi:parallel beta-helix repeat protein
VNTKKKFWLSFIVLPLFPFGFYNEAFSQSNLESGIEEVSENQFVDEFGYVHVLGEIKNKLNTKMDFVKATVAYYDSQNRIIGSDSVYTDPSTLLPGQSATYQALTSSGNLASNDVSSVKVNYEYEADGITHQSLGQGNRMVTSNTAQSSGQQNSLTMGSDSPDCGKVIQGNFTLSGNIVCNTKDGLIVGGHNTIINLNGYTIKGPGVNSEKVGISIPASDNVVIRGNDIQGNGSISNFQAGILISGSQNTDVNRITFQGNKIGIFMTGAIGTTVQWNTFDSNTIGIASHSTIGTQLHANMMTGNDLAGITLVNTDRSQIDANSIGGSRNGIYLDSQSTKNKILYNNVLKNDIDINNADGLPLAINGNELLKNNCFVSTPSGGCNPQ